MKNESPDCFTISVQTAAKLYGCSPAFIRKEIKRKNLRATTDCKNWRIDKRDFEKWYDEKLSASEEE